MAKSDSTFVKTTCGNRIKGTWRVDNDSLQLFVASDSLLEKLKDSPNCSGNLFVYTSSYFKNPKNEFYQEFQMNNGEIGVECFVKVE